MITINNKKLNLECEDTILIALYHYQLILMDEKLIKQIGKKRQNKIMKTVKSLINNIEKIK